MKDWQGISSRSPIVQSAHLQKEYDTLRSEYWSRRFIEPMDETYFGDTESELNRLEQEIAELGL